MTVLKQDLDRKIFAFVVVVLICLVIFSFYGMIKPEDQPQYNYDPYPNISPTTLPDAQTGQGSCMETLTPCDAEGKCSACGEGTFTCTEVERDGQYELNNIRVSKGKWCLPTNKKSPGECGAYTGKWLWTTNNETKQQEWKCECLYPDLYRGDDCRTSLACTNKDGISIGNLTGTKDAPAELLGKQWTLGTTTCKTGDKCPDGSDCPGDGKCTINTMDSVLSINPYSFDPITGNPWFKCSCDGTSPDKYSYINLPNDPYRCHVDRCWKNSNYAYPGATCTDSGCTCDCQENKGHIIPDGTDKGLCATSTQLCPGGGVWKNDGKGNYGCDCTTLGGGWDQRQCTSTKMNRAAIGKGSQCSANSDCGLDGKCDNGWCQCLDYNNNLTGFECYNYCKGNPCNGGECSLDRTSKPKYIKCNCDNIKVAKITDCNGKSKQPEMGGQYCENTLYPDGTWLTTSSGAHAGMSCTIIPNQNKPSGKYCTSGRYQECDAWGDGWDVCGKHNHGGFLGFCSDPKK